MRIRRTALFCWAVTISYLATAVPAFSQINPEYLERVDVEITNVDVFVEDREGNRVSGLRAEDFALFEDGVEQDITNFAEIGVEQSPSSLGVSIPAVPAEESPELRGERQSVSNRLILLIQNSALSPFSREKVLTALEEMIGSVTARGTEVMILVMVGSGSPELFAPFTEDSEVLGRTLDRLRHPSMAAEGVASHVGARIVTPVEVRRKLAFIESTIERVGGLPGRKAMLLLLKELPRLITSETESIESREQQMSGAFPAGASSNKEEGGRGPGEDQRAEQWEHFDGTEFLRRIVAAANERKVTLYPVFGEGMLARMHRISGAELQAKAGEEAALSALPERVVISGEGDLPMFADIRGTFESFGFLAEETGGITSPPGNNFSQVTEQVERDLFSYYSLGYRSSSEAREVSIRVNVKRDGVTVRTRRSISRRSTVERARSETTSALIAGDLLGESSEEIPIDVRMVDVEKDLFRATVILEIKIPLGHLVLLRHERGLKGSISVIAAAEDSRGGLAPAADQEHQIELPLIPPEQLAKGHYVYELPLRVRTGSHRFSIRVVDLLGETSGSRVIELNLD